MKVTHKNEKKKTSKCKQKCLVLETSQQDDFMVEKQAEEGKGRTWLTSE